MNLRVADHVHALDVARPLIAEHQAQPAADGLLRQDVGLRRVRPQADDDRHVLHVPALAEHHDADDAVDRAVAVVHVAGHVAGRVQVFLRDLAGTVGVDDEQPVAAELGRVLSLEPVANVVGLGRVVHHDEQDRLLAERGELLAVFLPALDAGREVGLIARTGDFGLLFADALGDALQRSLHDAVEDRLLERVVEDGPREKLSLRVPRRGREIELRGQPAGHVGVQIGGSSRSTRSPRRGCGGPRRSARTTGPPRAAMRGTKSSNSCELAGGFGPSIAVITSGSSSAGVGPLVQLLDVGQVERAERAGPFALAAHVALKVPEDAQFVGDHRVGAEDAAALEIGPQSLEDDDVRRDQQKRLGEVVAALGDGVEVLPGDRQAHHLGLAAAGRHLDAVAGEVVVLEQLQVLAVRERLDQVLLPADLGDLVELDERFDGVALGIVVFELAARRADGGRSRTSNSSSRRVVSVAPA